MTERTYLDMLRDELTQAKAKRAGAAERLAGDEQYSQKVLAGWDRVIAQLEARIKRESGQ